MMHMRKLAMIAAMSAGYVAAAAPAVEGRRRKEPPRSSNIPVGPNVGSIAQGNRWTGKPHEHRREIARRLRRIG